MLDAMKWSGLAAVSCAALMLAALVNEAWAGGRASGSRGASHSGHHHRGGARVFVGGAFFFGPAYYYPYGPGYYYPLPAPEYIQQDPAPDAQYWYYCPDAGAYYPYVGECPGGWQRVLPEPDPQPPAG